MPEGIKYLERSASLDQSTTKINEILEAFAKDVPADIYVQTHATAPFVTKESFETGLKQVQSGIYDSALAVKKLQEFIWKDGKPFNYTMDHIPRTQDLPPIYVETSGFYIYTRTVLEESGCRVGSKPYLVEVSEIESVDIDELADFEIADAIFNHLLSKRD